jgi:phospholipase C
LHTGKKLVAGVVAAAAAGAAAIGISVSAASTATSSSGPKNAAQQIKLSKQVPTATPIKHVVVLFDENISFDHYFGTYPNATNTDGSPFTALPNTPAVNGLTPTLLNNNPNADNPQRLSPADAVTCDQNHSYTPEQSADDNGNMDKFVQNTTGGSCSPTGNPDSSTYGPNGIVMDYYDGNTVTGLWNLAQHFTLNDNFYDTQFGPSSPGAINVISGDTTGAVSEGGSSSAVINGTLNGDVDPYFDECSNSSATPSGPGEAGGTTAELTGQNIGDLLNTKDLTWGWFQGGFAPSSTNTVSGQSEPQPVCASTHTNVGGATVADYSPHHEPFQYYASTSNPYHLAPAKDEQVGTVFPKGVNHQYDLSWFNNAVKKGYMPAVSYLKAPEYEDGHAGYSDPLDEQRFIVDEINEIEQSKYWPSTAIFITYDDSDGWYDHQLGTIVRGSQTPQDTLNGVGQCGTPAQSSAATADRCGVGPRLPLLVISPWAKQNYVDGTFAEQASIPAFIEDNWGLGRIGGNSADSTAGSLMNAFNFDQSYGSAPAIIMNDTTGEIEKTIKAKPPKGDSADVVTHFHINSARYRGFAQNAEVSAKVDRMQRVAAPKVSVSTRSHGSTVRVLVRTHGGSGALTTARMRVREGNRVVVDRAVTIRNGRGTAVVRRNAQLRAGSYRVTVTVDRGGEVSDATRAVRIAS